MFVEGVREGGEEGGDNKVLIYRLIAGSVAVDRYIRIIGLLNISKSAVTSTFKVAP